MSFPTLEQDDFSGQPGPDEYRIPIDAGFVVLPGFITRRQEFGKQPSDKQFEDFNRKSQIT
jgi:hypothetical protein